MCSSREDKGISPSLETTDKRSRALGFSRRVPNSSSNGTSTGEGSKSTKVKSGTAKTSRSGSEGNAGKGFYFKSLSLKRGIFEQFVSDRQKRWREPTNHKFEGSELVHSLQTLQDGRFALPEICVAKRGLHVQNRPEGCILQCSSTQRFTKISTVSSGRELVRVPVPMLWFGTSSQNIQKIFKSSNLSSEMAYDKGHNLSRRFIDFGKQCEQHIYGKGLCDLPIATSKLCNKFEECVLDPALEIEFLGLIVNSKNMTLLLPAEKIGKIKDQCLRLYKASKATLLDLTKLIRTLSSTIQAVLPARLQFRFLQQQQIVSLKQSQSYLTLVKLTSMAKNELLWWVNNLELCNGRLVIQPRAQVLIQTDASKKNWGLYVEGSERGVSGSRRNRIYISISWNF